MQERSLNRRAPVSIAASAILIGVTLLFAATLITKAAGTDRAPIRIMPLGDSITQSRKECLSYRYYLWVKLKDAGINFDFVGSLKTNTGGNPPWPRYGNLPFDSDHEGHNGWRTGHILDALSGSSGRSLQRLLQTDPPDILLIHIGTNDVSHGQDAEESAEKLRKAVEIFQAYNPDMIILLAKLIPARDEWTNSQVAKLNAQIERIEIEADTATSSVILVDQNTGFNAYTDTLDGLHPTDRGEVKMADRWFEAILAVIDSNTPAVSPAI